VLKVQTITTEKTCRGGDFHKRHEQGRALRRQTAGGNSQTSRRLAARRKKYAEIPTKSEIAKILNRLVTIFSECVESAPEGF
jgi:hypothetical protein